ncbi:adiponectin receptor protein 1-like [Leucoraja erinacea]|uniref:adiponectin receptor protein 1-like n=1 Tax=Leucoraja erinaceus TaxID=7782 RepID=UPI002458B026|nr:adiponectin receptor protein 1-like [Leucoraja erinacea]
MRLFRPPLSTGRRSQRKSRPRSKDRRSLARGTQVPPSGSRPGPVPQEGMVNMDDLAELEEEEESADHLRVLTLPLHAHHAIAKMEEFVFKVSLP